MINFDRRLCREVILAVKAPMRFKLFVYSIRKIKHATVFLFYQEYLEKLSTPINTNYFMLSINSIAILITKAP